MKDIKKNLRRALLMALVWPTAQAMATSDRDERCWFDPLRSAGIMQYERDLGTLYVPRDARIGRTIATFGSTSLPDRNLLVLTCDPKGKRINFDMAASFGVHPPIATVDSHLSDAPILNTSIPGVGAIIMMGLPFQGGTDQFNPEPSPYVPFTSWYEQVRLAPVEMFFFNHTLTLVKTGDLSPGIHVVDGPLITGHVDTGLGKVLEFSLRASIIQTQCDVLAATSALPVDLGEWNTKDFTGPGFTTTAKPFRIRLSNCQVDSDPDNETLATIELHGINGSKPVGPAGEHVFSLTDDSDARGVGIQMLYAGKPMQLGTEHELIPLKKGEVPLDFEARFYQLEASSAVGAGLAKGALNFTIRYR
ncbi:fimbrial protein [Pseudomonas sp. CM27]|uniref:fimbrial protein n=1 Tax=Pseudomonas sp. CM27 TaxID=2738452 RepID=UPI0015542882|nr:fimbrial protein [Pseudomonas sp. CM27]NQD74549.1 type 1 fimbrial protein [Pseudomonas sp. CM27]